MKAKRFLAVLLTVVMLIGMLQAMSLTAFAYSGSGTEDDPYIVTTYAELRTLVYSALWDGTPRYIKLGANLLSNSNMNDNSIVLRFGQNVVLDLAGYSITRSELTTDESVIKVYYGTLTINDSIGGGQIVADQRGAESVRAIYVLNEIEDNCVTINGGTFIGKDCGIYTNGGTVVINGGTFLATNYNPACFGHGVVTVNGGIFGNSDSEDLSIEIFNNAEVTLYNCTAYNGMYSGDKSWPSIKEGTTVTINGVESEPKGNYFHGNSVEGNKGDKIVISTPIITGMGADVTGFELLNSYFDVEATPLDSSKYTIRDITWSDCHLTDDSPIITDSSMFEAGETWQLKLWFKPAAGYAISNPATLPVTIAGQTATYAGTDGNYYAYKIEKTFSKYLHDYIDLSMDAPTSGMTPAEYAETIKIKNNDRFPYNNFEIGEVQCYRTDWNEFSTFSGGTTYFITVEIDLKDDTSFEFAHHDSDITALLNGTPVEDYVVVDADSTWKSNFYTHDGVKLYYQVYFTAKGEPTGVTVSGTVTSAGSDTDYVTIELYAEGSATADYTVTVKGNSANYSIAGVEPGTYTMKVMKKNHVTRVYTVTVSTENVTQDVEIYLIGDVTGDGGGTSVKYNNDGKVVISAPKPGNYKIIIASYSGESLLKVKFADITLESGVDSYEITDLNGFDTTGADTVKVFFWDTEMRPQCVAAVKTLS